MNTSERGARRLVTDASPPQYKFITASHTFLTASTCTASTCKGDITCGLLSQPSEDMNYPVTNLCDLEPEWGDHVGRTLLHAAESHGNADVVSKLLSAGAQPGGKLGSDPLLDMPDMVEDIDVRPWTTFCLEAALGSEEVARFLVTTAASEQYQAAGFEGNNLLVAGACPFEWENGMSPLHIAAECGFEEVVSALLIRGADKNALDDEYGQSPLIKAVEEDHPDVVDALSAAGADVDIRDEYGLTALDHAAVRGQVDVIEAILRHQQGAAMNTEDGHMSALHHAADNDEVDAIDVLVQAGADLEVRDSRGHTPFGSATWARRCDAMRALLQHGANPDARDNDGNSHLHLACGVPCYDGAGWSMKIQQGFQPRMLAAVDFLLQTGADEKALNNKGETPAQKLESTPALRLDAFEQTLLLLARASAERAWRRRSWLSMLRSRASKARSASLVIDSGSGESPHPSDGRGRRKDSKIARKGHSVECTGRGVRSQASNERVFGGADGDQDLRDMVACLIELELEGVFRAVVGFL